MPINVLNIDCSLNFCAFGDCFRELSYVQTVCCFMLVIINAKQLGGKMIRIEGSLEDNYVNCDESVTITGVIDGKDNKIIVGKFNSKANISLNIHGSNNTVFIDSSDYTIKSLKIDIGNFNHANNVKLLIGKNFQCSQTVFFLYNPSTELLIGDSCMFSNGITIRLGELPHLIFDKSTKNYIDLTEGVYIGSHVWIGEGVYVTKKASIPEGCVVAAKSVVTKRFTTPNCVLAGNPAKEAKVGVEWIKNRGYCKSHNSELSLIFEDYYNQAMQYDSQKIENYEEFIETQRLYLKSKNK